MSSLIQKIKDELLWGILIFVATSWLLMAWDIKTRHDNTKTITGNTTIVKP